LTAPDGDELAILLFRQDDVLTRRQALRFLSPQAVRRRVDSGKWRAAHRGVLVAHNGPVTPRQRLWIAVLASGRVGYLAGATALELIGLRGYSERAVHVLLPADAQASNPPSGVRVHRTRALPEEDRRRVDRLPCTSPARSMVDAAQWARSDDAARTIVAACFQQRLVTLAEATGVLDRRPNIRRRALIVATVTDAAGGAHSLGELEFVELCRRAGLPSPRCQVSRVDAAGRHRLLDAVFDGYGVRVEIDGAGHLDPAQWWADLQRQNDLWITGERVLRFPVWAVRERPAEVLAQVRAALAAGGKVDRDEK
jgi:hypothetical protein